ncbi:MAG: 50S ribosomal protein L23, partial [Thermodesulfobacteriota bacterium]
SLFNVKVDNINTNKVPGKVKRMGRYAGKTSTRKKAYVTLKEGESIEGLFGGA